MAAERNGNEVWVVNHLSDWSVVRLTARRVCCAPCKWVTSRATSFAGPNRDRAFVTAAFRGQNRPASTLVSLTRRGQGRADVCV